MSLLLRIDNNVVAIIVSLIFTINILGRLDIKDKKNIVFFNMFIFNIIELCIETSTCIINKQPSVWLVPLSITLHLILFTLAPIVTYMWYLFSRLWVYEEYKLKGDVVLLIPLVINTLLTVASPFFKTVFYIDQNNVYHRGSLFFVSMAAAYFYLLVSFIFVYRNKDKIRKIEYFPLLLFGVFPAVAALVQSLFYGFLLIWSSIAFSMIIAYVYLQQGMMHTDYLTGAWTREKFYLYLNKFIDGDKGKEFAIVFIDLDGFKSINDTYGHAEGDKALKAVVSTINGILPKDAYIARYGGDEFVLILNTGNNSEVKAVLNNINDAFGNYNNLSDNPYDLKYSYGYKIYDDNLKMSADEFINHVDKLMYKAKQDKKIKNK